VRRSVSGLDVGQTVRWSVGVVPLRVCPSPSRQPGGRSRRANGEHTIARSGIKRSARTRTNREAIEELPMVVCLEELHFDNDRNCEQDVREAGDLG